ncbi:hypothetical protein F383_26536 [Gossypium arboreum]|uniref:Uncharacterized protein n=1 Tax=Gossypium arboreum TaxID=29729 RepID=A0A0B0PBG4_GOSAR|nr:hypothetical protein F383_26536 [Gossypium arboreum]
MKSILSMPHGRVVTCVVGRVEVHERVVDEPGRAHATRERWTQLCKGW